MFFGYRSGEYPISQKAWGKLERAERRADGASGMEVREEADLLANAPGDYGTRPLHKEMELVLLRLEDAQGAMDGVINAKLSDVVGIIDVARRQIETSVRDFTRLVDATWPGGRGRPIREH